MNIIKKIDDIQLMSKNDLTVFYVKSLGLSSDQLFILIRNLALEYDKVRLDFSEFDDSNIVFMKWLLDYEKSQINVGIQMLDKELAKVLSMYLKNVVEDNYQQFINDNNSFLEEVSKFISSSVYYSAALASKKEKEFLNSNELCQQTSFGQNVLNVFQYIREFEVDLMLKKYPKFVYSQFKDQRCYEKFLQLAQTSIYSVILYGQNTPQWSLFQSIISKI